MTNLMNKFRRVMRQTSLAKDERGLSTVEYVIILVLIAAASVATWKSLGTLITDKLKGSHTEIEANTKKDG